MAQDPIFDICGKSSTETLDTATATTTTTTTKSCPVHNSCEFPSIHSAHSYAAGDLQAPLAEAGREADASRAMADSFGEDPQRLVNASMCYISEIAKSEAELGDLRAAEAEACRAEAAAKAHVDRVAWSPQQKASIYDDLRTGDACFAIITREYGCMMLELMKDYGTAIDDRKHAEAKVQACEMSVKSLRVLHKQIVERLSDAMHKVAQELQAVADRTKREVTLALAAAQRAKGARKAAARAKAQAARAEKEQAAAAAAAAVEAEMEERARAKAEAARAEKERVAAAAAAQAAAEREERARAKAEAAAAEMEECARAKAEAAAAEMEKRAGNESGAIVLNSNHVKASRMNTLWAVCDVFDGVGFSNASSEVNCEYIQNKWFVFT